MATLLICLGIYVAYTATGIWWFCRQLGNKYRKPKGLEKFLDHVLIVPLLPYASLIGFIFSSKR